LSQVTSLPLLGGDLALDFVNTVDPRHAGRRIEYLGDYDALVDWAVHADVLTPAQAGALRAIRTDAVHRRALALRQALYELFAPAVVATDAALARLNRELQRAMPHAVVRADYRLAWADDEAPDRMLWAVAWSAAQLLTGADRDRVRECDGEACGWLFLDTSKAGRRRWCSMAICGNRAKLRRHRARRET
jgi:predicted RNA-binding Zn ribbon-like protein